MPTIVTLLCLLPAKQALVRLSVFTVITHDEIAGHRSMAALTLLQKHIHQRDLAELVDRLAPILLAGYLASSQVISLVH